MVQSRRTTPNLYIMYEHMYCLPDASRHAVQTYYLQLLEKIEDIGKYAWGDALLRHLECSIKRYKKHHIHSLTENSLVLQVTNIYELKY